MKTLSIPTRALAMTALVMSAATPSFADAPNFRHRLPNPAQKIAEKIHKVGDIFFRTARVLEGALPFHGDEGDYDESEGDYYPQFMEPPPYYPPYQPHVLPPHAEYHPQFEAPPPPYSRSREDYDYLHEQAERNRLETKRSANRPEPYAEPMPLAPSLDDLAEPKPQNRKSPKTNTPFRPQAPSSREESVPNPVPTYRPLPPSAATPKTESVSPSAPIESNPLPAPIPTAPPQKYQYGRSVPNRPGLVYPPGREQIPANMVDVRGISPGTKVRDPSNGSIFLVP